MEYTVVYFTDCFSSNWDQRSVAGDQATGWKVWGLNPSKAKGFLISP